MILKIDLNNKEEVEKAKNLLYLVQLDDNKDQDAIKPLENKVDKPIKKEKIVEVKKEVSFNMSKEDVQKLTFDKAKQFGKPTIKTIINKFAPKLSDIKIEDFESYVNELNNLKG